MLVHVWQAVVEVGEEIRKRVLDLLVQLQYWTDRDGAGKGEGIEEGDVMVTNHPQLAGGSHLPDITVITPVFDAGKIVFYVASRGQQRLFTIFLCYSSRIGRLCQNFRMHPVSRSEFHALSHETFLQFSLWQQC